MNRKNVLGHFIKEFWSEGNVEACDRYLADGYGTHKGDFPGFPASGKQIKISGATVYDFDDDRIAGHWQVTDRLSVFQQLRSIT